jgi:hypothetical protein
VLVWILVGIALALAGFAALALLGLRLWRQVREFGRVVAAAGDRLAAASDELQRVTPRSP